MSPGKTVLMLILDVVRLSACVVTEKRRKSDYQKSQNMPTWSGIFKTFYLNFLISFPLINHSENRRKHLPLFNITSWRIKSHSRWSTSLLGNALFLEYLSSFRVTDSSVYPFHPSMLSQWGLPISYSSFCLNSLQLYSSFSPVLY
jgi:hypothetical protein